ncbi:MAG: glutathionylspermidine synthase family protein [Parcubacteria group bacterium]
MKRIAIEQRKDWQLRVEEKGLLFHHTEEGLYWDERAYYKFTADQIDVLDDATNELHKMCLAAVSHVIEKNRFAELGISPEVAEVIRDSWRREDPSLYDRFDFVYDGINPPKMLEYNADTPTGLQEASISQWFWLEEVFGDKYDQFNSIHEKLLETWNGLRKFIPSNKLHLACVAEHIEDLVTTTYLQDTAEQAGIEAELIFMGDIGFDAEQNRFVDMKNNFIGSLFKLYPWEWLVSDQFGPMALANYKGMLWLEPIWKMILSNKGLLPILWELYPNHENLLPAYFDGPREMTKYVRKPLLSREGANVTIFDGDKETHTPGSYGEEGYIYQGLAEIPCFDGNYPVLGCWVIGGHSAGLGIRESKTLITDNFSRFVPHLFE